METVSLTFSSWFPGHCFGLVKMCFTHSLSSEFSWCGSVLVVVDVVLVVVDVVLVVVAEVAVVVVVVVVVAVVINVD